MKDAPIPFGGPCPLQEQGSPRDEFLFGPAVEMYMTPYMSAMSAEELDTFEKMTGELLEKIDIYTATRRPRRRSRSWWLWGPCPALRSCCTNAACSHMGMRSCGGDGMVRREGGERLVQWGCWRMMGSPSPSRGMMGSQHLGSKHPGE